MTSQKKQRLLMISVGVMCLGAAISIILTIFEENLVFFYSPTDIQEKNVPIDKRIRVGGLVKEGSIDDDKQFELIFELTDMKNTIKVKHQGIIPPMFRGGQGIVAEGKMVGNKFIADNLLTKHDENYMPPEVAEALKKSGHWQEDRE